MSMSFASRAARALQHPFFGTKARPSGKALSDEERQAATAAALGGSKRPAAAKSKAEEDDDKKKKDDGQMVDDADDDADVARAESNDDEPKKDDVDDDDNKDEDEDKKGKKGKKAKAESEDDDPDGDDEDKEMRGTGTAAAARRRERERCEAILGSKFAARNPALALKLAVKTSLPRGEALAILEGTPAASLDPPERQRAARNPDLGPGGSRTRSTAQAVEASWETVMKRVRPGSRPGTP